MTLTFMGHSTRQKQNRTHIIFSTHGICTYIFYIFGQKQVSKFLKNNDRIKSEIKTKKVSGKILYIYSIFIITNTVLNNSCIKRVTK